MLLRPRTLVVPVLLLGVVGCGGAAGDDSFDAAVADRNPDSVAPDGSPDGGLDGDGTAPDAFAEDAAVDVMLDAPADDAVTFDAGGDGAVDAPQEVDPPDAPIPALCGDGLRDPLTEECDDGIDSAPGQSRACTSSCTVVDRPIEADPEAIERRLGQGRHPTTGGPFGHAVALLETTSMEAGSDTSIAVLTFSPVGESLGLTTIADVLLDSDPVLATLPDGDYALAHASLDADDDGLGIMLCRIPNAGGPAQCAGSVTGTTAFSQRAPDLLWTGAALVLGWEDESTIPRQVCTLRFDGNLQPLAEQNCRGVMDAWQSTLTLGSSATAWREDDGQASVFAVELAAATWTSPFVGLPSANEAPAIVDIAPSGTLVVYGDDSSALHAVVLDGSANTVFASVLNDAASPRSTPSLAVTDEGIYLAWREPSADPDPDAGWDPAYEELWLQRLAWDGMTLDTSAVPIPLPRMPWDQTGDQRKPSLAAVPYSSGGAVFAAWNHLGRDVIIELIPTPVLRKTVAY